MNKIKLLTLTLAAAINIPVAAGNKAMFIEPDMVTIPAGTFEMGGSRDREQPLHQVTIPAFKLAKYEVTVAEFRQFIKATNHKTRDICWVWQEKTEDHNWGINRKPGNWQLKKYAPSDKHPVMCVTWEDAKAYADWLSKKTGKSYRLPTEAEWEYAARAGSSSEYPYGNEPEKLCQYANILDEKGATALAKDYKVYHKGLACNDGASYTQVVGSYKPNAFGLYDMIGNVGEYVLDCEHLNYNGAPTDGSAWSTGCNQDRFMVIVRGGDYASGVIGARVAFRAHAGPDNASSLGEGFRLAESIE